MVPTRGPQRVLQDTHTSPQERAPSCKKREVSPQDACVFCVDQKLSQRMANRHRDRDNQRRPLVVWESAENTRFFGVSCNVVSPRLVGWTRRSRSASHLCFFLDVFVFLGLQEFLCVCRWACLPSCGRNFLQLLPLRGSNLRRNLPELR